MGLQGQNPTGVATGVNGSLCSKEITTVIGAGLAFIPAAGQYYAYGLGVDVRFQVQDSGGGWNNLAAAGVGLGNFETDGTNVRVINNGGGSENITLIKVG